MESLEALKKYPGILLHTGSTCIVVNDNSSECVRWLFSSLLQARLLLRIFLSCLWNHLGRWCHGLRLTFDFQNNDLVPPQVSSTSIHGCILQEKNNISVLIGLIFCLSCLFACQNISIKVIRGYSSLQFSPDRPSLRLFGKFNL